MRRYLFSARALILMAVTLCMTSCRLYERSYLYEIPIPEIKMDSIDGGGWDDTPQTDTVTKTVP